MIERIYFLLWAILAVAFGLFYLTGYLTAVAVIAFGFIMFGLIFLGMIGILPNWVSHQSDIKH